MAASLPLRLGRARRGAAALAPRVALAAAPRPRHAARRRDPRAVLAFLPAGGDDNPKPVLDRLDARTPLALGLVSATQGRFSPAQMVLDISAGSRTSRAVYTPQAPPQLELVRGGDGSGFIFGWSKALERAETRARRDHAGHARRPDPGRRRLRRRRRAAATSRPSSRPTARATSPRSRSARRRRSPTRAGALLRAPPARRRRAADRRQGRRGARRPAARPPRRRPAHRHADAAAARAVPVLLPIGIAGLGRQRRADLGDDAPRRASSPGSTSR